MSPTVTTPPERFASGPSTDENAFLKRVLLVDDEETIRLAIAKFLRSRGYDVRTAESGAEALRHLESDRFACMLCDVRMPGMSGVDLVPKAVAMDPELAIMMLSAVNDAPTATVALTKGALDYLMKPIELPDLAKAVERALHKRALLVEQRRVEQMIREEVEVRTAELEREKQALSVLTVGIAQTLINAMEAKDVYLRGHSQRTSSLAAAMAEELGLDADMVEHVRLAGRLHDIGKIGIREVILNKPSSLTPEEFEHVKNHVRIGMEILSPLKHIGVALQFVHDHHEHWNGQGYPRGLAGDDISIGGRILAAADAYDALTSKRAYREPLTGEQTVAYLGGLVGKLLDGRVYDALKRVVERRGAITFLED